MKKYEKEIQEAFLNSEETVIKDLKRIYARALKDIEVKADELQSSIVDLQKLIDETQDDASKEVLLSMQRSKIYQKQYQDALKKQIGSILDTMQVEEFTTVADYLNKCYEEGFISSMYSLMQQGIPLCFPIDQAAVLRAVMADSKISEGLYTRLGEDITELKKKISSEVSRGIATGRSFQDMAAQLRNISNIGYNNAIRITRTEGHRVQVQSGMEACYKAKEKGADVLKQWDSTLDKRTRKSHQRVDGEIRELDEPFSNGLMYPGDPSGGAAEVVNCRCALLQRAKWALDESELDTLKERAAYYGLNKTDNFNDFKSKYLKVSEELTNSENYDNIISGAVSGGRNPFGEKAREHAKRYYASVRKMKTDVSRISKATGIPENDIQDIKNFIFLEKHDLGNGELEYFAPDYMMAESWQRLIDGKPEKHDLTLIDHEIYEKSLMAEGMSQDEAHRKASSKYNYSKEAGEYYAKITKYKKE